MAGWLIAGGLALILSACGSLTPCDGGPACPRVLFIGNSYTLVNDLPGMFAALAQAGGQRMETGTAAAGGWTLAQHLAAAQTLDTLNGSPWTYVVLQEQSQIPAVEAARVQSFYPAARGLAGKIKAAGGQPIFFMTPAHRDGWPENGLPDYASMQSQLNVGYITMAKELQAPAAPVGPAWALAVQQRPALALWQADGSHPTPAGTYLAACVFYAVIFRASPAGLAAPAEVPAEAAAFLQALAASTVLDQPRRWYLPEGKP